MFVVFAVVTWLMVLVPSLLLMRRRPEDLGLSPDGIDATRTPDGDTESDDPAGNATTAREPIWSRREVLATRAFWLLAVSFAVASMAFQGINMSLAPYIQDLGYTDSTVALAMTARAAIMAGSLPLMGLLAEHSHRLSVRVAPFAVQGIAAILFVLAEQPVFLWMALAVYGIGMSGVGVIQGVIWANYFGRFSLGLVRSLAYLVAFGLGSAGPIAMNTVFDVLGSYKPAFVAIGGLFGMAMLFMAMVHPPRARRHAGAGDDR